MSHSEEDKRSKFIFAGVSPDLLRATTPTATPVKTSAPVEEKPAAVRPAPAAPPPTDVSFSKAERTTGESHDPYGLRQGKEACLKSVLQRLRSGRMNPIEEAKAMGFLLEEKIVESQAQLAEAMSKPKSKVSEKLSILKLPKSVLLLIERNPEVITEGHAVELMRLKDPALVLNVAERIIEVNMTRDRLRTEIGFLLKKHGEAAPAQPRAKREGRSYLRYFPKVDGGFDVIYRYRPDCKTAQLETLVQDMESKLTYLRGLLDQKAADECDLTKTIAQDIGQAMREARDQRGTSSVNAKQRDSVVTVESGEQGQAQVETAADNTKPLAV